MRYLLAAILVIQLILVTGVLLAIRSGILPLGVAGEWQWLRLPGWMSPNAIGVALAVVGVGTLAAFAAVGQRSLAQRSSPVREAAWVLGLVVVSLAAQTLVPNGAPPGYDLARWANIPFSPGSTGYYKIAQREIGDPWWFLADYPAWIKQQDSLHIGTHPPGLVMAEYALLHVMRANPKAAGNVVAGMPWPVQAALRLLGNLEALPAADRAALALSAALTVLACAATVVPLYLLARSSLAPPAAWCAAVLWPLVPSTILFQPVADTAFPLVSTAVLALAAWAPSDKWGILLCFGSGVLLACGMMFTLAFLPVGLITALVLVTALEARVTRRFLLVASTGAGFLVTTLLGWWSTHANPFVIWWWNLQNHARFYVEYPRTYRAWVIVNPIEFMIGLGIPVVVWALVGFGGRRAPRVCWATLAVLVLLNFSGKNLSEVGRLWLPFMPPLLVAAAAGLARLGAGSWVVAVTLILLGVETLALESMIQVVYPIVPLPGTQ